MENDIVNIRVKLSEEDYCKFQEEFLSVSGTKSKLISSIIAIFLVVGVFNRSLISQPISLVIYILFMVVLVITIIKILPNKMRDTWINQYYSNKELTSEQNFIFSTDGLERFTETSKAYYKWRDLFAHLELKDTIMIFTSNNQCFCIPKNSFSENNRQLEIVRGYINKLPVFKLKKENNLNPILIGFIIFIIFIVLSYTFISIMS